MTSEPFARFRFSFFEDADSARQGLDIAALAQLAGEERADAEEMLVRGLPDPRSVIGLGVLRAHRAVPALSALFEVEQQALQVSQCGSKNEWRPYALLRLAKALSQINPDRRWLDPIVVVLASARDAWHRQSAAEALGDIKNPVATQALIVALDDAEALVRYHAGKALLSSHGLSIGIEDTVSMLPRVTSQDARRRESGKQQILAAIAGPLMA
jgi:HEAT repeat protein